MPVLTSHIDRNDETYRANRQAQLALIRELDLLRPIYRCSGRRPGLFSWTPW